MARHAGVCFGRIDLTKWPSCDTWWRGNTRRLRVTLAAFWGWVTAPLPALAPLIAPVCLAGSWFAPCRWLRGCERARLGGLLRRPDRLALDLVHDRFSRLLQVCLCGRRFCLTLTKGDNRKEERNNLER